MSEKIEVHFPVPSDDAVSRSLVRLTELLHKSRLKVRAVYGFFGGEFGYGTDYENDTFAMRWYRQHPRCDCGGSRPRHRAKCARSEKRVSAWISDRLAYRCDDEPPHPKFDPNNIGTWGETIDWSTMERRFAEFAKKHPFPSCSCGEDQAWLNRNPGKKPNENDDGFESPHPSDFKHADSCDWSILYHPNFMHKPSGSTVCWYKYIGRDMEIEAKAPWPKVIRECVASIKRDAAKKKKESLP